MRQAQTKQQCCRYTCRSIDTQKREDGCDGLEDAEGIIKVSGCALKEERTDCPFQQGHGTVNRYDVDVRQTPKLHELLPRQVLLAEMEIDRQNRRVRDEVHEADRYRRQAQRLNVISDPEENTAPAPL